MPFPSLFLDVKSAFAAAHRHHALHDTKVYTDAEICCIFERFGFEPEIFTEFVVMFKGMSSMSQANVPKHVSDLVASYYFDTFFCIDDSSNCVIFLIMVLEQVFLLQT